MSSTIMLQSMCNNNNQIIDLGMFGSHFNQVAFYCSLDSTFLPVGSEYAGGPIFMNTPQTLPMPPINYYNGVSPLMIPTAFAGMSPMAFPSITPPPMNLNNMPSRSPPISPMDPMSGLVPVPMMGYSMISPESQYGFLVPEMAMTPPCSISRSCTPVRDEISSHKVLVHEISRERLPSSGSCGSIDSNSTGIISKKELVAECLNQIDQIFGNRVQTAGMRGPTVMRIKVKTRPALELIVNLLRTLEQECNLVAISCPKSTKKGKQHIRGFLAYIQANTTADIDRVQHVFDEFNRAHTTGEAAPFKTLEVNPQRKIKFPLNLVDDRWGLLKCET